MKTVRQIIFFAVAMLAVSTMLAQDKPAPAAQPNPELVALQKEWDELQTKTQLDYSKIRDLSEVQAYLQDLQQAQRLQAQAQQLQAKLAKSEPAKETKPAAEPAKPQTTAPPAKK